jgi:hypothetical protein
MRPVAVALPRAAAGRYGGDPRRRHRALALRRASCRRPPDPLSTFPPALSPGAMPGGRTRAPQQSTATSRVYRESLTAPWMATVTRTSQKARPVIDARVNHGDGRRRKVFANAQVFRTEGRTRPRGTVSDANRQRVGMRSKHLYHLQLCPPVGRRRGLLRRRDAARADRDTGVTGPATSGRAPALATSGTSARAMPSRRIRAYSVNMHRRQIPAWTRHAHC